MIELRRTTDIERLMAWRAEVLACVFGKEPDAALLAANRKFYAIHMADGSHEAIIACIDGTEAGCGAVCFYDEMPSPDNTSGKCAYIMNIYVHPQFRHRGIASHIIRRLIADAHRKDCGKIYLETTAMGRSVYASLGFRNMADMMKYDNTDN